jgi:hypothetical protein
MSTLSNFTGEVRKFSRVNWWVYLIYFLLLLLIFLIREDNLMSVIIVTSLHFVADIFIMMMLSAYARHEYRQGTWHQIVSMLIFLSIKVYTGLSGGGWQYILADPIYILAAIKHYQVDIKHSDIRVINTVSMSILSLILVGVILRSKDAFHLPVFESVARCVQATGIFVFAIALATIGKERLRYQLSIFALTCMVLGSAWELTTELKEGRVVGLAISYMLLPLTVLAFYIKTWSNVMTAARTEGSDAGKLARPRL